MLLLGMRPLPAARLTLRKKLPPPLAALLTPRRHPPPLAALPTPRRNPLLLAALPAVQVTRRNKLRVPDLLPQSEGREHHEFTIK
jgi:hypothetical protein